MFYNSIGTFFYKWWFLNNGSVIIILLPKIHSGTLMMFMTFYLKTISSPKKYAQKTIKLKSTSLNIHLLIQSYISRTGYMCLKLET